MYNISETETYPAIKSFRNTDDMPSSVRKRHQENHTENVINTIESRLKGAYEKSGILVSNCFSGLTVIYVENRQTRKTEALTVNTIYIKHFSDIMTTGIYVSKPITNVKLSYRNSYSRAHLAMRLSEIRHVPRPRAVGIDILYHI